MLLPPTCVSKPAVWTAYTGAHHSRLDQPKCRALRTAAAWPFEHSLLVIHCLPHSAACSLSQLQVYLCARTYVSEAAPFGARSNIWRRPPPLELHEDGRISFADGTTSEAVDTVMFCTGYRYSYPFLAPTDLVDVAENRCGHQWAASALSRVALGDAAAPLSTVVLGEMLRRPLLFKAPKGTVAAPFSRVS